MKGSLEIIILVVLQFGEMYEFLYNIHKTQQQQQQKAKCIRTNV